MKIYCSLFLNNLQTVWPDGTYFFLICSSNTFLGTFLYFFHSQTFKIIHSYIYLFSRPPVSKWEYDRVMNKEMCRIVLMHLSSNIWCYCFEFLAHILANNSENWQCTILLDSQIVSCYYEFDTNTGSCVGLIGKVTEEDCCLNFYYGFKKVTGECMSCR